MYHWASGVAEWGNFEGKLWKYPKMSGEGIRFSKDRSSAERLQDGKPTGESMPLEEAVKASGLPEAPPQYSMTYLKELDEENERKEKEWIKAQSKYIHKVDWTWKGAPVDIVPDKLSPELLDAAFQYCRSVCFYYDKPYPC